MEITINSQSKTISFKRGTKIKELLNTLKDLSQWEDYSLDVDTGMTIHQQWSGIHYIPTEKMHTTCDYPKGSNISSTDTNNKNITNLIVKK